MHHVLHLISQTDVGLFANALHVFLSFKMFKPADNRPLALIIQ